MSAPPAGLGRDDLAAAVAANVLSEAQAARLLALGDARRGAREGLRAGDEPFELFRGMNEVFIVTGLLILAFGWAGLAAAFVALPGGPGLGTAGRAVLAAGVGALVLWLLSEYFVRRRRMVAPAIVLSLLWGLNALAGAVAGLAQPFMVAQADYASLPGPLALATGAVLIHWWRFRVPFALALAALGVMGTALVLSAVAAGAPESPRDLFLLSGRGPFAWVTLLLGLGVFALAMAFDLSDPHRVTRRAAQGFWLHVVAAPALVNPLSLTLLDRGGGGALALLAAFLLGMAAVAVVIDRRSFLVAGAGYAVALAGTLGGGEGASLAVLGLGAALLLLGAFWDRARAALLSRLPFLPLGRLPPAA